jgi:hypothetical protein
MFINFWGTCVEIEEERKKKRRENVSDTNLKIGTPHFLFRDGKATETIPTTLRNAAFKHYTSLTHHLNMKSCLACWCI